SSSEGPGGAGWGRTACKSARATAARLLRRDLLMVERYQERRGKTKPPALGDPRPAVKTGTKRIIEARRDTYRVHALTSVFPWWGLTLDVAVGPVIELVGSIICLSAPESRIVAEYRVHTDTRQAMKMSIVSLVRIT